MVTNIKNTKNTDEKYYTCPMHPEVSSSTPGKCPRCDMDLVLKEEGGHPGDLSSHMLHEVQTGHNHAHHDHAAMMSGPGAAADFLHRFLIVSLLLIPLL